MCAIYNLITIEPNMTRFCCPKRFDLQLENFGVDTSELKKKAPMRDFRGWLEDCEKLKAIEDLASRNFVTSE